MPCQMLPTALWYSPLPRDRLVRNQTYYVVAHVSVLMTAMLRYCSTGMQPEAAHGYPSSLARLLAG